VVAREAVLPLFLYKLTLGSIKQKTCALQSDDSVALFLASLRSLQPVCITFFIVSASLTCISHILCISHIHLSHPNLTQSHILCISHIHLSNIHLWPHYKDPGSFNYTLDPTHPACGTYACFCKTLNLCGLVPTTSPVHP